MSKDKISKESKNSALRKTAVMWRFIAFKNLKDYNEAKPYFEKLFDSHTDLKIFSAKHSSIEKVLHPEYVSTYHRL